MSDNYFPIGTLIKVQGHNLIYLGYINDRGVDDEYGVHLIASEDSFTIRTKNDKIYSSTVHWLNYTRVAREFVIDHAQQVWDTFPFTQKERSFFIY